MTTIDKIAARKKRTLAFWNGLRDCDRLEMADQLVFGLVDLADWELRPGEISFSYLDELRINWEIERSE